ncbi:hypothetical protein OB2597_10886 [Pseudooceanicola batsensis HTCC2597]|uniref:Uncharacterized protein n=1 Tax=Pseudooceanicola batsensis (strain ATCC BAA-863 / DSM 15984 / KCTC 12145 / HTCC2597) TaxID=252305 RepID=A3TVU7_PSEBH|nr:DUF6478 family protein [Pseudooceanicola batsensis]EAQ03743.1 hypothetical protein OB2597_10886 [Pseudooceanicola batsensis HTCC2597]
MANVISSLLERLIAHRELRRWSAEARNARTMSFAQLRARRTRAHALRSRIDEALREAEARLALPAIGSDVFPVPHGTDWSWRPSLWRAPLARRGMASVDGTSQIDDQVSVHHDCIRSELSLRQVRNTREADLAPFGLRLEVFSFEGSFLSLVAELPPEALKGLERRHLIRLSLSVALEKPLEIFARLNILHGPNTEQIVRELPAEGEEKMVEFDLAYSELNEKRLEKAWIDLIFERPDMNQIEIRDLTLARCPRAEF